MTQIRCEGLRSPALSAPQRSPVVRAETNTRPAGHDGEGTAVWGIGDRDADGLGGTLDAGADGLPGPVRVPFVAVGAAGRVGDSVVAGDGLGRGDGATLGALDGAGLGVDTAGWTGDGAGGTGRKRYSANTETNSRASSTVDVRARPPNSVGGSLRAISPPLPLSAQPCRGSWAR
jgi:hypothetical protein